MEAQRAGSEEARPSGRDEVTFRKGAPIGTFAFRKRRFYPLLLLFRQTCLIR
jgi:hypothetical protein